MVRLPCGKVTLGNRSYLPRFFYGNEAAAAAAAAVSLFRTDHTEDELAVLWFSSS